MIAAPASPAMEVELRGAPWQLLKNLRAASRPRKVMEFLIDGPGGTGKSRGIGHVLYWLGYAYPGIRMIVTRKTRASLTEAFVQTWEDEIVPPNHPMLEGARRDNRHSYDFGNGTEMILGGLDKASRLYSTNYDVWYYQELFEGEEDEWKRARRALRNWNGRRRNDPDSIPFQLLLGDTNPDAPDHWLNVRCEEGRTTRLLSRHKDNPALYDIAAKRWTEEGDAYLESLRTLGEGTVLYRRLFLGEWCAAEGAVWDNFDKQKHMLDRPASWSDLGLKWFFGAVDWGYAAPGCMQVWGVDGDDRLYRVAEVYRTKPQIEWWAARAVELHAEFDLRAIVCDPARPDAISLFNDMLGSNDKDPMARIARPANNKKSSTPGGDMGGLDLVRRGLSVAGDGKPRMRFVRDALRFGRDDALAHAKRPWITEMEIPAYVFWKKDTGKTDTDQTDPACADHGCDTTRYAASFAWQRDLSDPPKKPAYKPWTRGALYGHDEEEEAA